MSDCCEPTGLCCQKEPNVFEKVKYYIQGKAYDFKHRNDESSYIKHAKRELKALGYDLNQKEEDPNKWICENLFELLKVLDKQGHSGFSIHYVVDMFSKLALFKTLSPITCEDSEWNNISDWCRGDETYQNNRLSSVFKKGKDGRPYYLNAVVFKDQNGNTFTGSVEDIFSSQYIRLPFTEKTFYVDVISKETNEEGTEEVPGSGWWVSTIKDREQLKEVFEYYDEYKRD